ncbi:MAG: metal-dependent hydrolase [Crocinitomicaceae bacterium]|nr:metal-dependent hydrolase [Crocinitomicaceae bacterium]
MNITYYGHNSFLVEFGGKKLLFDPFISGNGMASGIDVNSIEADYILLSHGHQDHILDAESIAKRCDATIISNFEIVSWYEPKGVKGHPMNHGGKYTFDFGTVKYVNAIHSSVLPDGTYGGNPGGFVIWNDTNCFYMACDTALTYDMKLIPLMCPKLDFAVLPMGDNFTMGIEEAVMASSFIECKNIIGCHYDTFPIIEMDQNKAKTEFESKGIHIHLPKIGETIKM